MKYKLLLATVVAAAAILLPAAAVTAHTAGQVPFYRVNGKYPDFYFIQNALVTKLEIPQTLSEGPYLAGTRINFTIMPNVIQASPDVLARTTFLTDFGDGVKRTGTELTHTFQRPGSYIVRVFAVTGGQQSLIESTLLHVLPHENYQLPQAVVTFNGQPVKALSDTFTFQRGSTVTLDASGSRPGSSPITAYKWDLTDGKTSKKAKVDHVYPASVGFASPVVRVYDKQGLFSDAYVDVQTDAKASNSQSGGGIQNIGRLMQAAYHETNRKAKGSLSGIFDGDSTDYGLAVIALGFAAVAGSLHSITPGHGKSVMAALLIGRRRSTKVDVAIVAGAITLTHTIVIFGLGFALLVLDAKFSLASAMTFFQKISAVLIILIAAALIQSGWKKLRHARQHAHSHSSAHEHNHSHSHAHDHSHHHPEARDFSRVDSKWGLFTAGASGGIIPCLDALSLLLLAVGLGHVGFGLLLVLAFSLGLAISVIAIGLVLLAGKHKFKPDGKLAVFADIYAPIISGTIIMLVAIGLLI